MKKLIVFIFLTLSILSCTKQIDYSKDINELKTQLGALQNQIGQLQRTTDSLNNELKITKSQVNVMSTKIDSLFKRIDFISGQILSLTTELNSKFLQLSNQISSDKTELTKSINDLISQISTYQKELLELTKQINNVKNSIIQVQGFEIIPVDSRLQTKNNGVVTVPVVIINYLPTSDGIYLDRYKTHNANVIYDDIHKMTLSRAKEKILKDKIIEKNSIEESSRFRDYGTNVVRPYINIDVVAYINVYDIKMVKVGTRMIDTTRDDTNDNINNPVSIDWYNIDFNDLLTKVNLKNYVDNFGAKEVWFTSYSREVGVNSYNIFETSMSPSLTSPDPVNISNGGMNITDLPRYNKSYVVYGFNGWRGVDTDLHNRGHQLERQMDYLSSLSGGNMYYGYYAKNRNTIGGLTHTPINTNTQYDYNNTTTVPSDISTWKPSGGAGVNTNNLTWLNKTYSFSNQMVSLTPFASGTEDWNKNAEVKWFIYWWQSIPGLDNNIKFSKYTINISQIDIDKSDSLDKNVYVEYIDGFNNKQIKKYNISKSYVDDIFSEGELKIYYFNKSKIPIYSTISSVAKNIGTLTNWWDLFYNWDDAITNRKRLFK